MTHPLISACAAWRMLALPDSPLSITPLIRSFIDMAYGKVASGVPFVETGIDRPHGNAAHDNSASVSGVLA